MRALASWGAKRHPNMPDVPTFKEQGYDVEAYLWVGLFTTAGLPEPTFKAMRDLLRRTLNDPLYKQAMQKANVVIDYRDTPEFTAFFREDHKRLGAAVHRIAAQEKKK
jgi:tripartite-type tricarboxylate transporter receptor subunit TctC